MKKCDDTIEDDDESENEIARPSFSSFFVFFAPFGLFLWGSFLAAKTKKHIESTDHENNISVFVMQQITPFHFLLLWIWARYIFGRKTKKKREGKQSQKFVVII